MNEFELFTADGKPAGVWACGICRRVGNDRQFVAECCKCRYCGKVIDARKQEYTGIHRSCWHEQLAAREAELMAKAEIVEDYDGPVFTERGWGNEGYFQDIGAAIDALSDEIEDPEDWPEFLYCCTIQPFPGIDAESCIANVCEDGNDDTYDLLDRDSIKAFTAACKAFNEANEGIVSWESDRSRKIAVPSRESLGLDTEEPTL